ncbi:Sec-independent protein translocase protein TatB [Chelatococcus sp. GCM10030263]|uniref:Sec-independent protein translocase protein TatB n=1 Tax=Chelatococcus sp. GCM10030263 TaxID=3273387 RepID=UPI00361E9F7A
MFDIGWSELLLVGAVALVVIGPKDLPRALRTLGQFTTKLKRMAADFQGQFNEAMREAELDDIRRSVESVRETTKSFNPLQTVREELRNTIEAKPPAAPVSEEAAVTADGTVEAPGTVQNAVPDAGTADHIASTPQPVADLSLPAVPPAPEPAKVIAAEAPPVAAPPEATATKPARKAPAKRTARGAPDELTALAEVGPATPRKPRTRKVAADDAAAGTTTRRAPRKKVAVAPPDGSSGEGSSS